MDSQRGGRQWNDSLEAEAEFRQTLLRLRTEGASNEETAEQVMRSPFVLGLLWQVTSKSELRTSKGAHTPGGWWERLRKDPDLRDEWRNETFCLLASRLRAKPDDRCDLGQNVGGYWRMKIVYAAIKAASNLCGESRFKSRYDREQKKKVVPVKCFSESGKEKAHERHEDERAEGDLAEMELRRDLTMLIDQLEDLRQRKVMRLCLQDYEHKDIASELGISEGHVLDAVERARRVLWKGLGSELAMRIDGLEDPRQREVMWLSEMEGYKYPGIAAKLGLTYEQVRYAAEQARKLLDGQRPAA